MFSYGRREQWAQSIATKPPSCPVATHPPAQKGSQLKSTRYHTRSTGRGPGTLAKDLETTPFFVKVCAGPLHIRAAVFRSFLDQQPANQSTLHVQAVRYTLSCRASGMNHSHCLSQCTGHSLGPENALHCSRRIGKTESWLILSCLADPKAFIYNFFTFGPH